MRVSPKWVGCRFGSRPARDDRQMLWMPHRVNWVPAGLLHAICLPRPSHRLRPLKRGEICVSGVLAAEPLPKRGRNRLGARFEFRFHGFGFVVDHAEAGGLGVYGGG